VSRVHLCGGISLRYGGVVVLDELETELSRKRDCFLLTALRVYVYSANSSVSVEVIALSDW